MKDVLGVLLGFAMLVPTFAWGQSRLENPANGSTQSGISVVSGWKCSATNIILVIDSTFIVQAAYGTIRSDTQDDCGDQNNGFGVLVNWNLLGEGTHTMSARDNGVEFASATFTVTTFGEQVLTGAAGQCTVQNFPFFGQNAVLQWQESTQSFTVVELNSGGTCHPGSGCCAQHGDVCSCVGNSVVCCDGTVSPTCRP